MNKLGSLLIFTFFFNSDIFFNTHIFYFVCSSHCGCLCLRYYSQAKQYSLIIRSDHGLIIIQVFYSRLFDLIQTILLTQFKSNVWFSQVHFPSFYYFIHFQVISLATVAFSFFDGTPPTSSSMSVWGCRTGIPHNSSWCSWMMWYFAGFVLCRGVKVHLFLLLQGFYVALRLVACAQGGQEISLSSLNLTVPPPKFVSLTPFVAHKTHSVLFLQQTAAIFLYDIDLCIENITILTRLFSLSSCW